MVKIKTTIFLNGTKVKLTLSHKINVIQGDSGCGKTYLTDEISHMSDSNIYVLSNNVLDPKVFPTVLDLPHDYIFWCDEAVTYTLQKEQLLHKLNSSNHVCVFISRDVFKGLDYPASAVYKLVYDSETSTYYNEPLYKKYNKLPCADAYITEDTKAGYEYFNYWLLNVKASSGDKVIEAYLSNSCLIADNLAFGVNMSKAIELGLSLYLPKSFEHMLGSKVFSKDIMENYTVEDMTAYNNNTEERCITRIFREQCSKLSPPINYHKDTTSIKDPRLLEVRAFDDYIVDHYGITQNVADAFGIDWNDEEACKKLRIEIQLQ